MGCYVVVKKNAASKKFLILLTAFSVFIVAYLKYSSGAKFPPLLNKE